MGEAETSVRFTIVRGYEYKATARRNECRGSKAAVRDDEEAVGRTQKTVALVFFYVANLFRSPIHCGVLWDCDSGNRVIRFRHGIGK